MKIIFAGTPPFARVALESLLAQHDVRAVYTQPDRPSGRGRQVRGSEVKQLALTHSIPVRQPLRLSDADVLAEMRSFNADIMVVVAYGLILPASVLEIPSHGCVNIHASTLPRWRGAAPIQRAIMAGDESTGVTIIQMDKGLDTGPMLRHEACVIDPSESGGSLHDKLAELGANAVLRVLRDIATGDIAPKAQDDSQACYAKKIQKDEVWIDWQQSALSISRQVRAFNPWPVARFRFGDAHAVHVWGAEPAQQAAMVDPGTVVAVSRSAIEVATGQGILRLTKIQSPGRRPMDVGDWLNAHQLDVGVRLPQ